MLYPRWQRLAKAKGDALALWEGATGRRWTFAELAEMAEANPLSSGGVHFPQGNGLGFVMDVLRAWRSEAVVCPLEVGQAVPVVPEELAGIVHLKTTSATTGAPRLVGFTGEQLAADANNIVETMGLRPEWPNVSLISLAHSYGFSNLITPLLLHGIPLILADSPLPESLRRASALAPAITVPGVPALWRAWHEAGVLPANIRLAISAGAPLSLALEQAIFEAHGLKIHNFYGATECGGIAYDATAVPRLDPSCVGTALRGVELKIGSTGCLEVRSGAVGLGYVPEPHAALSGGVYQSSDLAEIIDGQIHLRGRASDQINVAGRKISPEIIERALLTHGTVRDALVFGAHSAGTERSDLIVACVVTSSEVPVENLRQHLLTQLPAWQVPREWRLVPSLAPNNRGKLSRADWRARLGFAAPGGMETSLPGKK